MAKNKVAESGVFLVPEKRSFPTTIYHAFHHVLTIKKPRSTTRFFQNTPQKHQQKAKNPTPSPAQDFF
jgi:hypothetical protein